MSSKGVLAGIVVLFALTGCFDETANKERYRQQNLGGAVGIIQHLKRQNLPTVEAIEIWPNKFGEGIIIVTGHYRIYTTLLDPLMLGQVPGFMESAYNGYNRQLPRPIETRSKFDIYLFATRAQWEEFTEGFTGSHAGLYRKIKAGAYYLKDVCVVYNIGRERTFSVLGHEGWHQFNKRHFRFRLPSWLDEGIAMLFEVSRYEKGLFYFEPDKNLQRLGSLKKTLAGNKMIPLDKLIGMNPGEVLATDSDQAVAAFYSQSYALVRFLCEDDYGKRFSGYQQILLGGLRGTWPLDSTDKRIATDRNIPMTVGWNRKIAGQLFETYIGSDFGQIEKEYIRFCRKIVYHVRFR
ncbi:MAG: hypothetical protein JXB29_10830 [Sedimentisphaerales bacterium]|nr:hypothetical protein [Sedimentisphaerales bacterium]